MANAERSNALQTIFSFFLGLMVTVFVGVGVYTFHPPNLEPQRQIRDINRQEQGIQAGRPASELTDDDRAELQKLADQRNQIADANEGEREAWGRSTSIILIVFATLVMAVSLVRAEQLPVISSGLLLGGVFTMVYGVGWIVATDISMARFVVMTVAFAITLALGYVRFVRRRALAAVAGGPMPAGVVVSGELERRVRDLEERMNQAAKVFGGKGDG